MGPDLVLLRDVLLVLAALVVVGFLGFVLRRRLLQRRGGTFDCSLRERPNQTGKGWMLGVARYTGDRIEWYRVFSYALRPRRSICRRRLTVVGRRVPAGAEAFALLPGTVVVECLEGERRVELGMAEAALTGFLVWLESAPPGQGVNVA